MPTKGKGPTRAKASGKGRADSDAATFMHDLNNLLMAAHGYATLLRDDLTGEQRDYAGRILTATQAAKDLVADYAARLPATVSVGGAPSSAVSALRLLLVGRASPAYERLLEALPRLGVEGTLASPGDAAAVLSAAPGDWDVVAGTQAALSALPSEPVLPVRVALDPRDDPASVAGLVHQAALRAAPL